MMCRLCAVINVPDPRISVVNILPLCARDESEVGWKADEIHDGVKIDHGNALHIPIGIRSSCKSIGVGNRYSLLRRGRERLRRRKGKIYATLAATQLYPRVIDGFSPRGPASTGLREMVGDKMNLETDECFREMMRNKSSLVRQGGLLAKAEEAAMCFFEDGKKRTIPEDGRREGSRRQRRGHI